MPEVKALDSFTHDSLSVKRGDKFPLKESVARDLEAAGLVELSGKKAAPPENKKAPDPENKKIQTSVQQAIGNGVGKLKAFINADKTK